MTNLLPFPGITTASHEPRTILEAAIEADLETVIVVGHAKDGELWFAGNKSDGYEILWLLEQAKRQLMEMANE